MAILSWEWLMANYVQLFQVLFATVILGETVTAVTPTKTDDGFVHRLGNIIDMLAKFFRIPNNVKKDKDGPPL